MQSDVSTPPPPPEPPVRRRSPKLFFLTLVLLALAFLGGYIPPSLRLRNTTAVLDTTQRDLRLANLHRRLGVAAGEAQRNNFASAVTAAREFFDGCAAIAQSGGFEKEPRTRNAIASYVAQRDEIMTALANADPLVKDRLAGMYLVMDGVLARRE